MATLGHWVLGLVLFQVIWLSLGARDPPPVKRPPRLHPKFIKPHLPEVHGRPPRKIPPPPAKFHHSLTTADLFEYFGTKDRHAVPDYVITAPRHVSGSRHPRSADSKKDTLEYHVTAFGETYQLTLVHNDKLVAPGCIIEHKTNGTGHIAPCFKTDQKVDNDCFYFGLSKNHNQSAVAMSTCSGLQGIISAPQSDHDLIIKPIKSQHITRAKRHADGNSPHLVFKRQSNNRLCQGAVDAAKYVSSNSGASVHALKKRSADELYMELYLVADKTLYAYHGNDLTNFLLTITNVAAARMVDPSFGLKLHLAVVRIKILEDDEPGLEIVQDVMYGLKSFCSWQEKDNPALDTDPLHYDAATLFTRLDLVNGGNDNSAVGLANKGGICTAESRCTYIEDTGVDTGITLAHELGHVLGLSHDGDQNDCQNYKNLMSTGGATGPESFKWSECSKRDMLTIIESGRADCLRDTPTHQEELPKDLPGVIYDADDQCKLWVGTKYSNHSEDPCSQLWCQDPNNQNGILKAGLPMMDGSECGHRKYCINAECVDIGADGPQPVDGGWSAWPEEWSECSRTCGGGVRTKVRKCDSPKPRFGGKECEGEKVKTNLCNVKPCNKSEETFKAEQCQATRNQPIDGQVFDWLPWDTTGAQECYLLCKSQPGDKIYRRTLDNSKNYKDGTTCVGDKVYDFYRCVHGTCQALSCDGHSDSNYKFDKCGVCGGDGSGCSSMTKMGTHTQAQARTWTSIIKLPKGASGIKFRNKNRYAKMTISVGGKPIFNENPSMPAPSATYTAEGVSLAYQKGAANEEESISISGPLPVDAEAQVFTPFADARFQPNITFEFSLPSAGEKTHEWRSTNLKCDVECGGGNYMTDVKCHKISDGSIDEDRFCNIYEKPDLIGEPCNTQPCGAFWQEGNWGECTGECESGTQSRQVTCVQKNLGKLTEVSADQCPVGQKPEEIRNCASAPCSAKWETSEWSQCSLECGRGLQTRDVKCISGANEMPAEKCKEEKPTSVQSCVQKVCDTSIVGDECADASEDCEGYGINLCTEYGDWAKDNCKLTCSFCSKTAVAQTNPGAQGESTCQDITADCPAYGSGICQGEYASWAEENCAQFCGKCSTQATTTKPNIAASCSDISGDCAAYGQTICVGEYADWAKDNCAKLCGHCENSAAVVETTVSTCADANADCSSYGESVCQGEYADWAKSNCAKMCGHCGAEPAAVATVQEVACVDSSADCEGYGLAICQGDYADWAKSNCAKMCGACGSA